MNEGGHVCLFTNWLNHPPKARAPEGYPHIHAQLCLHQPITARDTIPTGANQAGVQNRYSGRWRTYERYARGPCNRLRWPFIFSWGSPIFLLNLWRALHETSVTGHLGSSNCWLTLCDWVAELISGQALSLQLLMFIFLNQIFPHFIKNVVAVAAYSRLASLSQAKFHTKKLSPLVRPCAAAPAQSTTSAHRSLRFSPR